MFPEAARAASERECLFDATLWANIVDDDEVFTVSAGVALADCAEGTCCPFDADHLRWSDLTAEFQSPATAVAKPALVREAHC